MRKLNLLSIVVTVLMIICVIAFYASIFVTQSTVIFFLSLLGMAFLPLLLAFIYDID